MPRISGKDAEGLMAAYAKVHAPKEEVAAEEPIAEAPTEEISEQQLNELGGLGVGGLMRMKQKTQQQPQQAKPQLSGAQRAQQMAKDRIAAGRNTVTGELKSKPQAQKMAGGQGNSQRPVKTGGIQLGKSIKGGLSALGNLAGRAAGGIKQGVQSAASNIKKGAQAVAGALQNKGPIQGRQTGAQRRDQQAKVRSGDTAQAAQAPSAQKLSPAQQAQKMAKDRIAAGRNTVTGELKSKPKVRKVTSVMDMEGYDLIDDTVDFLISEGYVQNEKEALAIMSESEFLEGFDEGMKEILNESSENNK